MYKKDPLGLELSAEYWCPNEPFGSTFSPKPLNVYRQSLVQKQVNNFTKANFAEEVYLFIVFNASFLLYLWSMRVHLGRIIQNIV